VAQEGSKGQQAEQVLPECLGREGSAALWALRARLDPAESLVIPGLAADRVFVEIPELRDLSDRAACRATVEHPDLGDPPAVRVNAACLEIWARLDRTALLDWLELLGSREPMAFAELPARVARTALVV